MIFSGSLRSKAPGRGALAAILLAGIAGLAPLRAQESFEELASGSTQMIGQAAPSWNVLGWINSKAVDVTDLKGKVVLLRFFNDRPLGAKALNGFHRDYGSRGLAVVALYTPEPTPTETSPDHVRQLAATYGFAFPVGLDHRWQTLARYWLNRADADLTSTTFLIDRHGIIRYIQPDGVYDIASPNRNARKAHARMREQIETLLKEDESEPRP